MKLGTLISSKNAFEKVIKSKLPISIAWELNLFIKKVNPELQSFDTIRIDKIKEYGEEITEGEQKGGFKVKEENIEKFVQEINTLSDKEIDIKSPVIKKDDLINFTDKDGKPLLITIEDLELLSWLIVE